jgi:simple sugar transport system permease protein
MNKVKEFFKKFKDFYIRIFKGDKKTKKPLLENEGFISFSSSAFSVVIGLIIGLIILMAINLKHSFGAFGVILAGGFNDGLYGFGAELAEAAPLILVGLSIAFAFKTGLFNIGAAGQYTVGAFFALYCAIALKLPWYVDLLAAVLGGAIWGSLPGILKAYFNVNVVISSIMFNWIGLYAVNELIYNKGNGVMYNKLQTKTYALASYNPKALIPDWGLNNIFEGSKTFTIGFIIAILVAILIHIVLNKTTFGYELKACGYNRHASKYAGMNEKRSIILSMVIAGGLAGMSAGLYYLSGIAEWEPLNSVTLPAMGFNGISVALLASLNSIGTIFSALFISHITSGGSFLNTNYFSREVADAITGVIIYLCAFAALFKSKIRIQFKEMLTKKQEKVIIQDTDGGEK